MPSNQTFSPVKHRDCRSSETWRMARLDSCSETVFMILGFGRDLTAAGFALR